MVYVLVLILMLGAFAAVGWPLLSSAKRTLSLSGETSPEWEKLVDDRDAAYKALKELEFEHELGNLSIQDYENLRERYRTDAADVLRRLDELRRSGKAQAAAVHAARAEDTAAPGVVGQAYHCSSCGKTVPADDRFCANCGTVVQRVCPGCGALRPASDGFCGQCGARMETKA